MSYQKGVQELVQGYKALSDPTRLRILHLLGHQPLCVCHLQEILHLAQVPVSQHLAYLRKAGWVESGRHAQWKVYRLLPSLSPGLRAVLDGLLSAAKTQTLLLSDLEHLEAILKDPRYSFCCGFTTPRRRAKKTTTRQAASPSATDERITPYEHTKH
jgi:ArsR family transcriptional regulator, arsenate/arsenite/antimonite-responsive transcriptional repressor